MINFLTGLPILTNVKRDNYDSILVIVDRLIKMVHYKPVKITINIPGFVEMIIDVVVRHHSLPDSIVINRGSFFTLNFWSLLCYFFGIKWRFFTTFYLQKNKPTECLNSLIEAYLRAFVNFEQNDGTRLLPMAKFAYNNAKIASTGHTPFEPNCGYHLRVSFKEDTNPRSRSKTANKLLAELWKLITIC